MCMNEWLNNIFLCIKDIIPYGIFWDLFFFSLNINIPNILLCCCIVAMVHLFCGIVFCEDSTTYPFFLLDN